jgi:hypothetical protein
MSPTRYVRSPRFDLGLAGLVLAIAAWALLATAVLGGLAPLASLPPVSDQRACFMRCSP